MEAITSPNTKPYIEIVTQPDSKGIRFRYTCESRCASTIPGEHSTPEIKTYPTIKIVGYSGPAYIVVSCVTKDKPYKPHPHNLVARKYCKDGICAIPVGPEQRLIRFNFGVQCVTKNEAIESLNLRKKKRVDPFQTGFDHIKQVNNIDFKAIRLCFQVFTENNGNKIALQPVVSNVVYDTKAVNDFEIKELSHCSGPISGNKKVIILCNKVVKGTTVTFFDVSGWEKNADIKYTHKQAAITFTTPAYHNLEVTEPVKAFVQLRGRTVEERGDPRPFELIPDILVDSSYLKRKRQKTISMEDDIQPKQNYSSQFAAYCPSVPSTSSMSYPDVIGSSTYYQWDKPEPLVNHLVDENNEIYASYAPLVPVLSNTINVNQTPQIEQIYSELTSFDLNFNQNPNSNIPATLTNQDTQNVGTNSGICNLNFNNIEFSTDPIPNRQENSLLNDILSDIESGNIQFDLLDQSQESLENSSQSLHPPANTHPTTYWSGARHDGDVDKLSSRFSNLSTDSTSEDSI